MIKSKDEYYKLFEGVSSKVLGYVSPDYLFYYTMSIKITNANDVKKDIISYL